MFRIRTLLLVALASLVLAGCTHTRHRATAEAAYYKAQAASQAERQPIVEFVAQAGQAITLQGVERFAVYAPDGTEGIRQYQAGPNPWVQALGILGDTALKGYGIQQAVEFATSAVNNAGGNTSISNSGRMGSPGDTAGGDLIHGDRVDNSGRIGSPGDEIAGDRIDNSGRIGSDGDDAGRDQIRNDGRWNSPGDDRDASPGPIDNAGDCRDGGDCSTDPPDAGGDP
jgi:hypothetical protein